MTRYAVRLLFVLVLLLLGGAATGQLAALVVRWRDNMTQTPAARPGERAFAMPAGSVPRTGGALLLPKEEREAAAARKNPVAAGPESVERGGALYAVYCTPCHGPTGRGDGLVATKFVAPPDLGNPDLQKARTDGYWEHTVALGGAVMPGYAEALTAEERWHVVNFLRSLAVRR